MSGPSLWEELVLSGLESNEAFRRALRKALEELHVDTKRFSRHSGVSESALYKILSGERANPRLSTYRKIVESLKRLEAAEEIGEVEPVGDVPMLEAGENRVKFAWEPAEGEHPRAYVSVIAEGEAFGGASSREERRGE